MLKILCELVFELGELSCGERREVDCEKVGKPGSRGEGRGAERERGILLVWGWLSDLGVISEKQKVGWRSEIASRSWWDILPLKAQAMCALWELQGVDDA